MENDLDTEDQEVINEELQATVLQVEHHLVVIMVGTKTLEAETTIKELQVLTRVLITHKAMKILIKLQQPTLMH